jgi:hypothetical protein
MIEIVAGPVARSKASDIDAFWLNYYRKHDEKPEDLREKVALLNLNKKTHDVQAVLTGYLRYHGNNAEPWMYSALALAIRMRKGSAADVKQALGFAADLAERSRNPNDLVSVADQMILMGELGRVGALLDEAARIVPHRGEPPLMSMQLAQRTRDPKRMADAVERLLSLGWPGDPGFDEGVRRDARKQVETLARTLREDGKSAAADELLHRLTLSEARDLLVRLTWTGEADLDLAVDDPGGTTTRVRTPRTVSGGAIVKNGYGSHPEEVYVCPRGFNGDYTIRIETIFNNPEKPALKATLEVITHEGTVQEHKETRTIALGASPEAIKVTLREGRRKEALPLIAPTVVAVPKALGTARRPRTKPGDTPAGKPAERPAPGTIVPPGR